MAGAARIAGQGTLFEERFLGRYAGAIMADLTVALVELVANSWDAYATTVDIHWPSHNPATNFRIIDNGCGMTQAEFELRWRTLDYDRVLHQGDFAHPPSGMDGLPRLVYGRNGKGRLAGFYFLRLTGYERGAMAGRPLILSPRARPIQSCSSLRTSGTKFPDTVPKFWRCTSLQRT